MEEDWQPRRTGRAFLLLVVMLMLVVSLSGCSTVAPATITSQPSTAPSAVQVTPAKKTKVADLINHAAISKGGTLIQGSTSDIHTFNPILVSDTASRRIATLIFDGLVVIDPDTLEPAPDLATNWQVSSDNKVITFTLANGVKWQDGQPFTADDVKFSYDLYMNKDTGTPRAGTMTKHIKTVEVKNPTTVVFTLKDVIAPFLVSDAIAGIVPKHILGSMAPKDIATSEFSTAKPIGTGPFKFQEHKAGESVTLVANHEYFRGVPALDSYVWKFVKDSSALYQQLKSGDVDVAPIPPALYGDAKAQPNFTSYAFDTFNSWMLGYNLDAKKGSPIFQDVAVRQALFYAIDREGIVKTVRFGLSTVAQGTMPALSWAYQPGQLTTRYDFNPQKANQLLDQAGYRRGPDGVRSRNGARLSFKMYAPSADQAVQGYMTVFQQNWKDIGVEMIPQFEEFSALVTRLTRTFDFQAFLTSVSWDVDPDQQTMWDSKQHGPGFNLFAYSNPKVDRLLDQGIKTLDQAKRKQIYIEMQDQLLADAPALFIDFPKTIMGVNNRVGNFIPTAVSNAPYANLWYVKDGK